jgi:hypothetical protein
MTELTLFASTFVLVFALGLQSLNVNNGHFILAAFTSFVIGAGQMILYKLAPHASWSEIAAYLFGGPFGIMCSMKAHPHLVRLIRRKPSFGRDGPPPTIPKEDFVTLEKMARQKAIERGEPYIAQPQGRSR